jgi:predicted homoserine dehydrogenase-like protein
LVSEVATIAKRGLKEGEVIGEIGSPDILGRTYAYVEASAQQAIPLGIATGGVVIQDIAKGELLTWQNLQPDASKFVYRLRQMQDAQLGM